MNGNDRRFGPLVEWKRTLDDHRAWVRGWIADDSLDFENDMAVKLDIVCAVASHLPKDQPAGWQALGVVFGDALNMALGTQWGELTDEYGVDPCIPLDVGTGAALFPLTMLSKRAEENATLDRAAIINLFAEVATAANEHISRGPRG